MARQRSSPWPGLAASAALHLGVLALALFVLPWLTPPAKLAQVVPVTLVTSDETSSLKSAVEAPTPAPATTETPTPQAPPQPPAPEPSPAPIRAPAPAPPPAPRPKPTPKQPPPKPTPSIKPAPAPPPAKTAAKPDKTLDLDALAASLGAPSRPAGAKASSAQRGPNRAQTALKAQTSNGIGSVAANGAMASMAAELQRLWNPDCDVAGGSGLIIIVTYHLAPSGRLIGQPVSSAESASDPVVKSASDRAKRAVYQAQPFENLPREVYNGQAISAKFDAKQACAQR